MAFIRTRGREKYSIEDLQCTGSNKGHRQRIRELIQELGSETIDIENIRLDSITRVFNWNPGYTIDTESMRTISTTFEAKVFVMTNTRIPEYFTKEFRISRRSHLRNIGVLKP